VSGVPVSVCRTCGWRGFPERVWCPGCGGERVETEHVGSGVLEQRTTLRRAAGRTLRAPIELATVELDGGGRAIVRVEAGGDGRVALTVEDRAPVARPAAAEEA
jgi:uncharacterized OB-fold protein